MIMTSQQEQSLTSEQRLDRLERIAKLFVAAGLRARRNMRDMDEKMNILIDAQIRNEERFAKSDERFAELKEALWDAYLPNRVIALCADNFDRASEVVPLLAGRNAIGEQPKAYVCRSHACQAPVSSRQDLKREIESART